LGFFIESLREQKKIELDIQLIETLKASDEAERHERNTIELRENFQYGTDTVIDDKQLSTLRELCKKAIEQTKKILY